MGLCVRTDEERLLRNLKVLKDKSEERLLCAVVKANAYGHGAEAIKVLQNRVDWFAVATVGEGVILRRLGIKNPILVMSFKEYDSDICVENGLTVGVSFVAQIKALESSVQKLNKSVSVHIQIDSGMNRLGVNSVDELNGLLNSVENVRVDGVYSHICSDSMAYYQIGTFALYESIVKCRYPKAISHISATTSVVGQKSYGDMVRLGIGLYGYKCSDLLPVMSVYGRVLQIKNLEPYDTAGYDRVFTAGRNGAKLAVLDGGYADGVLRCFRNNVRVLYKGKLLRIVAVCMDTVLVDVTGVDVDVHDIMYYIGESDGVIRTADDIANESFTIPYEILTGFGNQARRENFDFQN